MFLAFHGYFKTFSLDIDSEAKDYDGILEEVCRVSKKNLTSKVLVHPIKAQVVVDLTFYKTLPTGEKETSEKCFRSICEPILLADNISDYLARARAYIKEQIQSYERLGSGWVYESFSGASLDLAKYNPLSGGIKVKVPINSSDNR